MLGGRVPDLRRVWLMLCLTAVLAACGEDKADGGKPMQEWVGKDFSTLSVLTLDGEPQPLKDIAGNQRIVLNVWATWCAPCVRELPALDALGKNGKAVVVAIATDASATVVKNYLREQPWGSGVMVWHDPNGQVTRGQMGATAIPVSYILGSDLVVRRVEMGEREWNTVRMVENIEQATSR